MQTLPEIE